MTLRFVPVSDVVADDRQVLAGLAHESFASYYSRLSDDRAATISALLAEFGEPATELATTVAAVRCDDIVGMVAAYPAAEMTDRQQASLFCHLGCEKLDQDRILAAATRQAGEVPPLAPPHVYIARIAVAADFRGAGAGEALVAHAASMAPAAMPLGLHVHRDNARALAFYRRIGFVRTDEETLAFQALMLRR